MHHMIYFIFLDTLQVKEIPQKLSYVTENEVLAQVMIYALL